MFWLHDVPTEDTADALRSAVEVTTHNDPSEDDAREVLAARLRMLCEDAEDRRDWVRVADLRAMLGTS